MRGTPVRGRCAIEEVGIIPAYAGNTLQWPPHTRVLRDHPRVCGNTATCGLFSFMMWDHPRVCGEHWRYRPDRSTIRGSSPRMRGTLVGLPLPDDFFGIIPAYAGNTPVCCSPSRRRRDHPRVCGEHSKTRGVAAMLKGSSPRMRGTPCRRTVGLGRCGIIPAYAGNTSHR